MKRRWDIQISDDWRTQEERRRNFVWRVWGVLLFLCAMFWTTVYFWIKD